MPVKILLTVVLGYLLGCFSAAYFLAKRVGNIDIREHGSGNAGTGNMLRVLGLKYAIVTLVLDALKGTLAGAIGFWLLGGLGGAGGWGLALGGFAAILGHSYPFYLKWKGGKGVATLIGVLLLFNFWLTLLILGLCLLGVLLVRIYSVFSLVGSLVIAIVFSFFPTPGLVAPEIIFVWVCFLQLLFMHRGNISRIITGKENTVDFEHWERPRKRNLK